MSKTGTALVWFHRDLRLTDNPALSTAVEQCARVIPLYIHAPEEEAPWVPGSASNWWLHQSLRALQYDLRRYGSNLIIVKGPTLAILQSLAHETGATHLFWNRRYEPAFIARDSRIKRELTDSGLTCRSFNGNLLSEPASILTGQDTPYKVFTAYWKACQKKAQALTPPLSHITRIPTPPQNHPNLDINTLDLLPRIKWYAGMEATWQPGEQGALDRWTRFLQNRLPDYEDQRDFPGSEGTSRLSPHLHFGEISPRQILWSLQQQSDQSPVLGRHLDRFTSQLGWREFAHYTLHHFPHSANESLDRRFEKSAWPKGEEQEQLLGLWQRGETGIPLVDAGMRELWHTGWMHNRVRMIVASFLTKNLGIHWREGARWFWDTLVDADLANNSLGWQWTAGCGVDAAPYFRVFNPARQAEHFDAGGYIQRWLPELKGADKAVLHNGRLDTDGPIDYPRPIVDLNQSRRAALQRWERIKRLERG
ncbi:deoxyribodipyrimidine photo-lyase [Sedimenticola selenatireducens]|uniref:cryptochrome/photolyase family protein n=1 Tax=Sedimenticola selenatireducens TaxID=191960 RepID=UPI00048A9CF9|nr:deoxyribodipyrimidine photo-lyase [Sedimenticola selenatireducens]